MSNTNALDDLKFDMDGLTYEKLAKYLEWWAEEFYIYGLSDKPYNEQIAYLLYNMSKEMRRVSTYETGL